MGWAQLNWPSLLVCDNELPSAIGTQLLYKYIYSPWHSTGTRAQPPCVMFVSMLCESDLCNVQNYIYRAIFMASCAINQFHQPYGVGDHFACP